MELELDIDHDKSRDTIDGREAPSVLYVLAAIAELIGLLCILLIAVWDEQWMGGFAWDGSDKEFNWHPLLVVTGFIFINGNSKDNIPICFYSVFREYLRLHSTSMVVSL